MLRSLLFVTSLFFAFNSYTDQSQLLNFDKKENADFFKSNNVVMMKYFSISHLYDDKEIEFYGKEAKSNFSSMTNRSCKIKVSNEKWIPIWFKKEAPTYVFFEFQKKSNKYKLIGYSFEQVHLKYTGKSSSTTSLKKFTKEDYKKPKYSNYISGGHEIYSDTYGHYWENKMDLHYPILFKEGKMNLYMDTYKLKKPLSLQILKEISENKYRSLVLAPVKGTLNTYRIVGYLAK